MNKRSIKADTIKMLLLRSGNKCSFPHCTHPIFNDDNLLVAQLCHIEGVSPKGQRYNVQNTIVENNSYDNLLFMCYRHHKETDDTQKYTVEKLKKIKKDHESKYFEKALVLLPTMIQQVEDEMNRYWKNLEELKNIDTTGLMMDINKSSSFLEIVEDINLQLQYLEVAQNDLSNSSNNLYTDTLTLFKKLNINYNKLETLPYYDNPLVNRDWELLNIGIPNSINSIQLWLKQLELKYLEEVLKNNISDNSIRCLLDKKKLQLEKLYQEIMYHD
ncbi:hypothetical protein HX091_06270 [Myroides odoratimimus]|uniref:hypothetical protein n=1 Tax=Myroides odoratimimus TaxID=76832 RepID=UPI002577356D|nr:hypothetical protein [Myroides odoratimimus]MDM1525554.1 hypothetical protein [Myroides odoratimimus]